MYPTVMVWGHGHFFKGGVETGEMINKHNGRHQQAKNSADKVWRCWTLIFPARVLDDNSFCSFQDFNLSFWYFFGRVSGWGRGGAGREGPSVLPEIQCCTLPRTPRALGDLGTSVRRVNRRILNRRPSWKEKKLQNRTKQGIYGNVLIVWNKWPFILVVSRVYASRTRSMMWRIMQIEKINGRRGYSWIQLRADNSSHHWKAEFNHCFIINSKYVTVKGKTDINGKTVPNGKTYQLILYQSIPKLPIPPSPSGPWVCLNIFAQIPRYADSLDGQMPHHLALWKFSNLSPTRDYSKMFLCVKPSIQM